MFALSVGQGQYPPLPGNLRFDVTGTSTAAPPSLVWKTRLRQPPVRPACPSVPVSTTQTVWLKSTNGSARHQLGHRQKDRHGDSISVFRTTSLEKIRRDVIHLAQRVSADGLIGYQRGQKKVFSAADRSRFSTRVSHSVIFGVATKSTSHCR